MVETLPECSLPLTLLPAGLLEGQVSSRDGCCSQHTISNAAVRVTSLPLTLLPAGLLEARGGLGAAEMAAAPSTLSPLHLLGLGGKGRLQACGST